MPSKITRAELDALLAGGDKCLRDLDLSAVDVRAPAPIDFSGADLDDVVLSKLDLTGIGFRQAKLGGGVVVEGACFDRADFTGASFVSFIGVSLRGALLRDAQAENCEILQCDARGADLTGAMMKHGLLAETDFRDAVLRDADLSGASFESAQVDGADFTGATVTGAKWKGVNRATAIGLDGAKRGATKSASAPFERVSSLGGPILAIPSELARAWSGNDGEDYERASDSREGKVNVCGWIETTSLVVGRGRALVLHGALETGIVPIEGGCVLVRGGTFDTMASAAKAVANACASDKGWLPHRHTLTLGQGTLWVFDSVTKGAAERAAIDPECGLVEATLASGSYAVDVKGDSDTSGPIAFIRFRRTTAAAAPRKAAATKRATKKKPVKAAPKKKATKAAPKKKKPAAKKAAARKRAR